VRQHVSFPFQTRTTSNCHHFIEGETQAQAFASAKTSNAFLWTADVKAGRPAADKLDAQTIRSV